MADPMIEAVDVVKSFGEVKALDGVSLAVPAGSILGLLGHNGAGKTTLVHILSTLVPPTGGTARVCGFDVVGQGRDVRRHIGLTGQFASIDEELSGRDNLIMVARLLGAPRREAVARTAELLELFDLTEAATRVAKEYSGGMRRRLDLAAGLVGRPQVVFLDEPTTGLDPTGRLGVWNVVKRLVDDGAAVLLTTQYLEEADTLADSITVLSEGRVVAAGTPADLKAQVGSRSVTVTLVEAADADKAVAALRRAGLDPTYVAERTAVTTPVQSSVDLAAVVRALDEEAVAVGEIGFAEPTLDDVYVAVTDRAGRVPAAV